MTDVTAISDETALRHKCAWLVRAAKFWQQCHSLLMAARLMSVETFEPLVDKNLTSACDGVARLLGKFCNDTLDLVHDMRSLEEYVN